MKAIAIYTDGACQGNPGPGGWAAVLLHGEHRRELAGGVAATTNNRMELTAAIEALRSLKEPCAVELFTDSQYLRQGITGWIASWKRNGWKTTLKQPVKNDDLWRELDQLLAPHQIAWKWVKGHAGNEHNERCDLLAVAEIAKLRAAHTPPALKQALAAFKEAATASAPLLFPEL